MYKRKINEEKEELKKTKDERGESRIKHQYEFHVGFSKEGGVILAAKKTQGLTQLGKSITGLPHVAHGHLAHCNTKHSCDLYG